MSTMNQIASGLYKAITESDSRKPVPYDTKAEVLRTDGDTVWVKIPGGIDETPVQKTNNAREGDTVMVRISGGRAWLLGNNTSPATDDTMAFKAQDTAITAIDVANTSRLAADIAEAAANNAVISADQAKEAADDAKDTAILVSDIAQEARDKADLVADLAQSAIDTTEVIKNVADEANAYATSALSGLSTVEDVVGVLEWVGSHRILSTDTTVVEGKNYYTFNEETGAIAKITPTGTENPSEKGWYEMSDAVASYVSTHLSLTETGLWIIKDNSSARLRLNEEGMAIYPVGSNTPIATYGSDAIIGDATGFHITITANYNNTGSGRVSFYRDTINEVAYISGDSLYINKSVVLQQMDLGTPLRRGGLGQWSWKIHKNRSGKNNLYLKWIG